MHGQNDEDEPEWPAASRKVFEDARVLIVGDQPANVAVLERLVRAVGSTDVQCVTDPRLAVQRCLEMDADLVMLDLHMSYTDGFAVLAALREGLPAEALVRVLVLTSDTTPATRDRALRAGAHDFIIKPFDRVEVGLRVRNLLETQALHTALRRHNAALQADLQQRAAAEQRLAEEHRRRHDCLDRVLEGDALTMVFQPIADLMTGDLLGVEALARFQCDPRRPPDEWFDDAADLGRGCELELAAVEAALRQLDDVPAGAYLSVNVSPATVLAPQLERMLDGASAHRIVLELTEHARIPDYAPVLSALDRFRDLGVRVAVDDAGAGYSGLRQVLRLRPEVLKLDTALTRDIDVDVAKQP